MDYRLKGLTKDKDLIFKNPTIIVNEKFTGYDMASNTVTIVVNLKTDKDNFIEIDVVVNPKTDNSESIYKKVLEHLKENYN